MIGTFKESKLRAKLRAALIAVGCVAAVLTANAAPSF